MKSALKKFLTRFLLFVIAIPAIVCSIIFLPYYHHLFINIIIIACIVISAVEGARFFFREKLPVSAFLSVIFTGVFTAAVYLEGAGILPEKTAMPLFLGLLLVLLAASVFIRKEELFSGILPKTAASVLILCYPGLTGSYLIRISTLPHPSFFLLFFILLVFLGDVAAYLFGMLFGKKGGKPITVISPNKTWVGFISGFLCAVGVSAAAKYLFPEFYAVTLLRAVLIGMLVGILTIIGDLAESALKRSAGVKDSGTIIPGRGGLFDSLDSLLFTAPVFYYLIDFLI